MPVRRNGHRPQHQHRPGHPRRVGAGRLLHLPGFRRRRRGPGRRHLPPRLHRLPVRDRPGPVCGARPAAAVAARPAGRGGGPGSPGNALPDYRADDRPRPRQAAAEGGSCGQVAPRLPGCRRTRAGSRSRRTDRLPHRTKRWWLFEAESIRWPRTSFFVHRSGEGRCSLSASENSARMLGSVRTANRRRSMAANISSFIRSLPASCLARSSPWAGSRRTGRPAATGTSDRPDRLSTVGTAGSVTPWA